MHTEHLQNVHPVRIMAGWLVSIAVTSVAVFGLIVLGLMGDEAGRDTTWAVAAVAVGFLVGGWFTGVRTLEAPILHGIALGLTSLLAWALLNLVVVAVFDSGEWTGLSPTATLVVLLTQIVAAVIGCRIGTRRARYRAADVATSPGAGVRTRGTE
jgi:MFS family permease